MQLRIYRWLTSKYGAAVWIVLALVVVGNWKVYFVREHTGGVILWNESEAYIFAGFSREGIRTNALRVPWIFAGEYFGVVQPPDDTRAVLEVIRVLSSGVERHLVALNDRQPGGGPGFYTPLDNHVYVNYPELGGLSKWAGDHFEGASDEERRRYDGISRLTAGNIDHGAGGWSKRRFGPAQENFGLTANVSDRFRILIRCTPSKNNTNGSVSIALIRHDNASEELWDFSTRVGRIAAQQYSNAFRPIP